MFPLWKFGKNSKGDFGPKARSTPIMSAMEAIYHIVRASKLAIVRLIYRLKWPTLELERLDEKCFHGAESWIVLIIWPKVPCGV